MQREDELYPGHHEEMRRNEIVEKAVAAADRIIMDGTNGTITETDYLTSAVAMEFNKKVHGRHQQRLGWFLMHGKPEPEEDFPLLHGGC